MNYFEVRLGPGVRLTASQNDVHLFVGSIFPHGVPRSNLVYQDN